MSPALRLLPMGAEHLAAVMAIERRAYEFPWSEANFRDSLHTGYSSWVLLDGEVLQGYALMSMAVGEAQILNICVSPAHRRQGLARQLLDHLLLLARAAQMERMYLEVRPSNAGALKLYAAYGFDLVGRRRHYYRTVDGTEDALVLARDIGDIGDINRPQPALGSAAGDSG
ncbi:MAG: rimI [Hydrocarboniphaga sp.]|uniref:ribosomal protein S18-alanine N-acetyltransferase n=1 Tax=Hydrocarboniphaga sp. TaxID=2033016 RepID=UPI002636FD25|nr:ribosomal protein S18-alanine N-acetyltransferase [Hydrocarboniphaga sp.]MDB5971450.1 rimI [Hydrocarboniphaga sp.]